MKFIRFFKRYWTLIAALLYVVSPIDLVPDVIPVAGISDDLVAVLASLLFQYGRHKRGLDKNRDGKGGKNGDRANKAREDKEILDGEIVE